MATRRPIPPGQQEELAAKAKDYFLNDFTGARVTLQTTFHNPPVIRVWKRSYYVGVRNWFLTTTIAGRLPDASKRAAVTASMQNKANETLVKMKHTSSLLDALIAQDDLSLDMVDHIAGKSVTAPVTMVGPVAMRYREILLAADGILDRSTLLYTMGAIQVDRYDEIRREVTDLLKGLDASLRNHRIHIMRLSNEAGMARPGYNQGNGTPQSKQDIALSKALEDAEAHDKVVGAGGGDGHDEAGVGIVSPPDQTTAPAAANSAEPELAVANG